MSESIFDTNPISGGFAITPADGSDLTRPVRGIYVGTSGTLKVDTVDGDTLEFQNLAAGIIHPIKAKRVYATVSAGTVVADVVGVY